ncbi:polysaccharide deacetylase family protein [Raineyella fluvialis]|uniref:Polysaccharide deacetylase family protein n=1 Tax=Raineyella fluvialis TaxID=2662261 RepID=A0A5Q2FAN7_9ACTN|nr:polysaccharide deacetylase family protein [Raineyella fluvialis]QGF22787.1 polysaccharide deacetylase family protein [Raineyella fluvialis]
MTHVHSSSRRPALALVLPLLVTAVLAACAPPPGAHNANSPALSPTPPPTPHVVAGTNHNTAAQAYAYPAAKVHDWLEKGKNAPDYPQQKIAFLTFDDGPSSDATPAVLDALKANNVPATFFLIAGPLGIGRTGPVLVQRELDEGNAVCIHSFSHDYGYLYPQRVGNTDHILADEARAADIVKGAAGPGYTADCFRYPGGHMSWKGLADSDTQLGARGLSWIDWNAMTGDAEAKKKEPKTPDEAAKNVRDDMALVKNPNVVVILMHDATGKKISTEALPQIVSDLRGAGYSFGVIA